MRENLEKNESGAGGIAEKWVFKDSPKYDSSGVTRIVPPAQTLRRISPLMNIIGASSPGKLAKVDRDGVHTYICARQLDSDGRAAYYKGKGFTRTDSKVSAMMEAIERYSAEKCDLPSQQCDYKSIVKNERAVNPGDICSRIDQAYEDRTAEWVEGYDLIGGAPVFAPLDCVWLSRRAGEPPSQFYLSSTGLASGNTFEEAVCHGICEVIEHDANSLAHTTRYLGPALSKRNATSRGNAPQTPKAPLDPFPLISLEDLPHRAGAVVEKLRAAGLKIYLRNITSDVGIPAVGCVIAMELPDGTFLPFSGEGAHPDIRVALARALSEAAQSRAAIEWLTGGDLDDLRRKTGLADPDHALGRGRASSYKNIKSYENDRIDEDIKLLLSRLKAVGLNQVVAFDLTRPETGIPVVRILIPKAEDWFVPNTLMKIVLGPRGRKALDARLRQIPSLR